MNEQAKLDAQAQAGVQLASEDALQWHNHWRIAQYLGDWTPEQIACGEAGEPFEVTEGEGNLLVYGGASCLWECLKGNGTATPAQTLTYFDNTNAKLGVGDSNSAAVVTQTDLQAGANKLRKAMDVTFPTHTDGTTVLGNAQIVYQSTFATGDANFAWEEFALFNAATAGRMLFRKVQSLITKTSAATVVFTVTITLA